MLRVVTVSTSSERANAERLGAMVLAAWPGIESSAHDDVTIAAGIKLVREGDLLVTFDLARPRPTGDAFAQAGAIVVEVKALDASRFISVGNDLRPIYSRGPSRETVLEQVKAQIDGLTSLFAKYDRQRCFIHGLVWLLGVTTAELREFAPNASLAILGSDATWADMLRVASVEHRSIIDTNNSDGRAGNSEAVRWVRDRLTRERKLSARDLAKLDRFTTEVLMRDVVDDVVAQLGEKQVRLVGRAGTGKSTTLALVARRAVERDQARVLVLTYQRVLRGELEHLMRTICGPSGACDRVAVLTMHEFLLAAFEELGGIVPMQGGAIDYLALPKEISAFIATRGFAALHSDFTVLRELEPNRFAFDYVFVDEAQDWRPAERDFLRALFHPQQTILADGLDQFAQRQSRCDWTSDVPKEQRFVRELNRSLRMSANVAAFVTAFARAIGFHDWNVKTHPDLSGGRVLLRGVAPAESATPRDGAARIRLFADVLAIGKAADVPSGDCLVAVPPGLVETSGDGRRSRVTPEIIACGAAVWDACNERVRLTSRQPGDMPVVPYGSIRGLEGWAAVLLDLDLFFDNKLRHPNIEDGDMLTAENVAKRALLLAVTRAAHVLAITVADGESQVARWLDEAAREVGADIVENA